MNERDALGLIATVGGDSGGVWADIGAGTGTFTRALRSLLRPGSRVYAVDNDPAAITALRSIGDDVIAVRADFSESLELPEAPLDGMLFANSLHFVPDAGVVLKRLVGLVRLEVASWWSNTIAGPQIPGFHILLAVIDGLTWPRLRAW